MITYVILFLFPQGFPFLFHAIKDSINLRHTTNLIFSLCRYNLKLAESVSQRLHVSYQPSRCPVIGLEALHLLLNRSDANAMSIITWPRSFSRASGSFQEA